MTEFFVFVCVIAIVVLIVRSINQSRQIKELNKHIQELDYKLFYNYTQIQKLTDNIQPPKEQNLNEGTNTYAQAESAVQSVAPTAPTAQGVPFSPASDGSERYVPNAPMSQSKKTGGEKNTLEIKFGSQVFNAIAALLVFIGLILLSMLDLPDFAKILSIFLASGWLLTLGAIFTKKSRSNFSLGLLGCGCGAFFISILVTHIYFNALPDLSAFALLLIWTCSTLYISKKTDSVLLSVTAHAGAAISICFAFSFGFSADRILLPIIYQFISIAVIIIGNIFCCKRTYRFGLIISMLTMLYSSVVMLLSLDDSDVSRGVICTLFIMQTVCASFLSYLLAVSAAKLYTDSGRSVGDGKNKTVGIWFHIANKTIWCVSVLVNVLCVFSEIFSKTLSTVYSADCCATLILAAVLILHTVISIILSEKLNFSKMLATISICFTSGTMSIALFGLYVDRPSYIELSQVTYIFFVAAALVAIIKLTDNKRLTVPALVLISIDGLFTVSGGYESLNDFGTPLLSIVYMLIVAITVVYLWTLQTKENRERYFLFFKGYIYFWVNFSVVSIINFYCDTTEVALPLTLVVLSVIHILLHIISYGKGESRVLEYIIRIASGIIVYVSLIGISETKYHLDYIVLYGVMLLAAAGLFSVKAYECLKSSSIILQALAGLSFAVLVHAVCGGYSDILTVTYAASVIYMVTSLICIILGFKIRAKGLRLYGLVVVILCVLKLVTIDMASANSTARVAAFIVGGIICFIISGIYNRFEKLYAVNDIESPTRSTDNTNEKNN